jgi:hypothetical protein
MTTAGLSATQATVLDAGTAARGRVRVGPLVSAAAFLAIGLTSTYAMDDPDFWWLLRGGQYMAETGSFPTTDPFSATAAGAEWLNHAWGFELVLYGVYRLGGLTGAILLQALGAVVTFAVLHRLMRREGLGPGWASWLLVLGALATRGFWQPRPQLATYLLLAVFLTVLADFQQARADRLRWLPLLMVAWVNLHGGFLLGPAVVALFAAGEVVEAAAGAGAAALRRAGRLALWAGACLAASLLNPFHYGALLFPLHVVSDTLSQIWIAEWTSPPFRHPQVMLLEGLLLLALLLALRARHPVPWRDVVVLLPFVHLGLQATRNTPLLVIVALPLLARAVVAWAPPAWASLRAPARLAVAAGAVATLAVGAVMAVGKTGPAGVWSDIRPRLGVTERFPEAATAVLRRSGGSGGTLLNEYDWGGYLIWQLYPTYRVSIDGRMAVYGPARFAEHVTITELRPGWREALDRLDPAVAILRTGSRLARTLRDGGWAVVHEDAVAVLLRPPARSG